MTLEQQVGDALLAKEWDYRHGGILYRRAWCCTA